jgi:hypothetical protein
MMARLFDKALGRLNEVRRENGLEPIDSVLQNFERADRLLLLTSRAFEYEQYSPPPNVRITGPRLDDPAWAGDWTPPAGDGPLVLVGMSSTFMDHGDVLQRATTALGELPVRGLVTTGRAIPVESIDAPPNVTVVERAPHSEVLPPRLGRRNPRGTRDRDQGAGGRSARRGAAAGPRPAGQRGARGASRRRPEAEAEGVERGDRGSGSATARRARDCGRRAPDR